MSCVAFRERRHPVSRPVARHCIGAPSLAAIERAHKSRHAVRRAIAHWTALSKRKTPSPLNLLGRGLVSTGAVREFSLGAGASGDRISTRRPERLISLYCLTCDFPTRRNNPYRLARRSQPGPRIRSTWPARQAGIHYRRRHDARARHCERGDCLDCRSAVVPTATCARRTGAPLFLTDRHRPSAEARLPC